VLNTTHVGEQKCQALIWESLKQILNLLVNTADAYKLTVFWKEADTFHQTLVTISISVVLHGTYTGIFWDIMMFCLFAFVAFWHLHKSFTWLRRNHSITLISTTCNAADYMHVVDWLRLVCQTANSRPMRPAIRHTWALVIRSASKPREQSWRDMQRKTTIRRKADRRRKSSDNRAHLSPEDSCKQILIQLTVQKNVATG